MCAALVSPNRLCMSPSISGKLLRGTRRGNKARSCATPCTGRMFEMLRLVTKLAIFPSLSHVMSCSVALRVGLSLSPLQGHDGEDLVDGQASGNDWNSEKLQKYLSANSLSKPFNSSGICFNRLAIELISRHTLQYIRSISARVLRSTMPCSNRSRASSRICSASVPVLQHGARVEVVPYIIKGSFTNL